MEGIRFEAVLGGPEELLDSGRAVEDVLRKFSCSYFIIVDKMLDVVNSSNFVKKNLEKVS